jgi:hypothetical protein
MRTAVVDLQRTGFWSCLTQGLYAVELEAYTGSSAHFRDAAADAIANNVSIAGDRIGVLCDVRFYVTKMPHVSLQAAWGSIVAHELTHCLERRNSERHAQEWEAVVYGVLG